MEIHISKILTVAFVLSVAANFLWAQEGGINSEEKIVHKTPPNTVGEQSGSDWLQQLKESDRKIGEATEIQRIESQLFGEEYARRYGPGADVPPPGRGAGHYFSGGNPTTLEGPLSELGPGTKVGSLISKGRVFTGAVGGTGSVSRAIGPGIRMGGKMVSGLGIAALGVIAYEGAKESQKSYNTGNIGYLVQFFDNQAKSIPGTGFLAKVLEERFFGEINWPEILAVPLPTSSQTDWGDKSESVATDYRTPTQLSNQLTPEQIAEIQRALKDAIATPPNPKSPYDTMRVEEWWLRVFGMPSPILYAGKSVAEALRLALADINIGEGDRLVFQVPTPTSLSSLLFPNLPTGLGSHIKKVSVK